MYSAATIAALAPFFLGLTRASPAPTQTAAPDVTIQDDSSSALTALGDGLDYNFACNPYNDAVCYKRWWDYYRYCHPYDRKCYRDCDTYDDYQGHCKNWDSAYGKCYDKCYYDQDSCDKYEDCYKDGYGDDDSCYKKKHKENYCPPWYDDKYKEDCYHEPPEDYCKPYDYDCHRKQPDYGKPLQPPDYQPQPPPDYQPQPPPDYQPQPPPDYKPQPPDYQPQPPPDYQPQPPPDYKPQPPPEYKPQPPDYSPPDYSKPRDEYKCHPHKDKDCYPGYPDYPDYEGDYNEHPQEPTGHVIVKFYNKQKGLLYEEKVWPDGEEMYTDHNDEWVDYIKYYAEKEDKNVRCLPMKNWFPWNPLPIYSYLEKDEAGYKARSIELKKPQPVEVIRCDFP